MRAWRRWVLPAAGVVLVAVGIAVLAQPVSVGWFAYTPAAGQVFDPAASAWFGGWRPAGAVALVLGLVLLAVWVGYRLGRRAGR